MMTPDLSGASPIPPRAAKKGHDDRSPHALVIGSGFGGLAVAVRLAARGYRVTVVDRLARPGGRGTVRRRRAPGIDGEFVFDSGPTVITAPFLFEDLWTLAGRSMAEHVRLKPVTPFYRIRFDDGSSFDYTGDAAAMRAEVERLSPSDVAGYERFVEESRRIFQVGFEKLAHVPFSQLMDMVRIVPDMMRLGSHRSVYSMVASHVKDERLRQVMSFHPLLVGGNPFATTSIYTLIAFLERKWGVHFPVGGTGALVDGLVSLIEDLGGTLRQNTEVSEILVRDGRATGVRLGSGEILDADVVVSNADSAWTYRHLIPERARKKWSNARIERARYSMSLFVWYFGTKRRYEDVAHHTILLGPRYRELLRDIFERKVVADDFSLYLHRPTATDPNMAPDGCDAFYVLSPVPHLQSGTEWSTFGETYRARIERFLSSAVLPDLGNQLVVSETLTPQGFQDDLLSFRGAAFGLEPVLTQSAWFRPHNESEDIRGLYFVGAGTHPGAGLPGVLSSARVVDSLVPPAEQLARVTK